MSLSMIMVAGIMLHPHGQLELKLDKPTLNLYSRCTGQELECIVHNAF